MTNNIKKIKKELLSYAKRCKDIHYTDSLLITFLITGMFSAIANKLFSAPATLDKSIENQRQAISTTIKDINQQVKTARKENNRLLRNTNLELVQLMEQGDYVIKSPWSSWQFGMNYFYNNWQGTYKGRGDKQEKYPYEGIFERSLNAFERYTSPDSVNYGRLLASPSISSALTNARSGLGLGYGIASTLPVPEPIISLELSAGIRPRKVDKQPLNIQLDPVNAPAAPTLNVSANTPVAVTPPTVTPPTVTLNLPTPNTKPFNDFSFTNGRFGDYEQPVDKKEAANTTYSLGYNPLTNQLDKNGYRIVNDAINETKAPIAAIWRINDKRGTLRNQDTEANWNSGMSEDVTNPIVHGFNYGGNSATDRVRFYVAGDINDDGTNTLGTNNKKGAIALHSVWNGTYHDIEGYLKGRSTMFSIETWHSPKLVFKNIKVDIQGNENTLFYIYPHSYQGLVKREIGDYNAFAQRGAFIGEVNADVKSQKMRYTQLWDYQED